VECSIATKVVIYTETNKEDGSVSINYVMAAVVTLPRSIVRLGRSLSGAHEEKETSIRLFLVSPGVFKVRLRRDPFGADAPLEGSKSLTGHSASYSTSILESYAHPPSGKDYVNSLLLSIKTREQERWQLLFTRKEVWAYRPAPDVIVKLLFMDPDILIKAKGNWSLLIDYFGFAPEASYRANPELDMSPQARKFLNDLKSQLDKLALDVLAGTAIEEGQTKPANVVAYQEAVRKLGFETLFFNIGEPIELTLTPLQVKAGQDAIPSKWLDSNALDSTEVRTSMIDALESVEAKGKSV